MEKQNLKRKHGEVKRFGALLMKITRLELNWALKTPDLHTKQSFMELKNQFPSVPLRVRSLTETSMRKKNPKPKTHFPAKANKQHCCFLQLGSLCLRFSH